MVEYRAVKKEVRGKVWYTTQYWSPYSGWVDDSYTRFATELEVRNYVVRLNTPRPTITTTVLE